MIVNILKEASTIKVGDLMVSLEDGWAYQDDYVSFPYEKDYWDRYNGLENTVVADNLNNFRRNLSMNYADSIIDIGIGSGAYLKSLSCKKFGYDVNEYAKSWLQEQGIWHDPYIQDNSHINGFCFWDVLEHMECPGKILSLLPAKSHIFVSMPIFNEIEKVHLSKHYRKNEHLCYFSTKGFVKFLNLSGFIIKEISSEESKIGRENILTFVAQKNET
jgi:hypothetical protein